MWRSDATRTLHRILGCTPRKCQLVESRPFQGRTLLVYRPAYSTRFQVGWISSLPKEPCPPTATDSSPTMTLGNSIYYRAVVRQLWLPHANIADCNTFVSGISEWFRLELSGYRGCMGVCVCVYVSRWFRPIVLRYGNHGGIRVDTHTVVKTGS